MADTSLIIGNGNWAVKETSLLGYNIIQSKYVPIEMTVVRATTATRVNSAGLIEVVPINLLTYSEQFDNAVWTKIGSTISANSTTAPNGTTTADKLIEGTLLGNHYINRNITNSNSLFSFSVFAKKSERNFLFLQAFATVPNNFTYVPSAYFDLDNGTVGTVSSATATIQDYGNGWYRCTLNCTSIFSQLSASVGMYIMTATANGVSTYLGNGTSGIFIWGAQAETGTTATEYFPTTDRFNIPRVDYSTGTASLLVEPLRTNSVLYSNDLSNAYWTKTNVTITANSITSPIAGFNSDSIVENSASNVVFGVNAFPRPSGLTLGTTYSVSFFAKKITRDWCYFYDFNTFQLPVVQVYFNLSTGLVGTSTLGVLNPKMENYGNGWYRCSFQFVATAGGTSIDYRIAAATSDNTLTYSGTIGQQSISVTACQLEAGSNATSYIPTVASSVTRNADVISKTGISSLIGQTEGTFFCEMSALKNTQTAAVYMSVFASGTNFTSLGFVTGTNKIVFEGIYGGVSIFYIYNAPFNININSKIAVAYQLNKITGYVNGIKVFENTTAQSFSQTLTEFKSDYRGLGNFLEANVKSIQLYKTRLTDTELAQLTTL